MPVSLFFIFFFGFFAAVYRKFISYYPRCSDPPLREEDIPSGTWLCLNCRMTKKPDPNAVHTVSVDLSIETPSIVEPSKSPASTAADGVVDDLLEIRRLRKRSNSHVSGVSGTSEKSVKQQSQCVTAAPVEEVSDVDKVKSPFDDLIKAAAILNPRQFELPRNMSIFVQFPGDDKSK